VIASAAFRALRHRDTPDPAEALLPRLPQDAQIQAYFNHAESALYTDPYRQQTRFGDDLEQVVIDAIHQAQTSIDLAVHELNLPRIALALRQQHQAGIRIRVIVEHQYRQAQRPLNPRQIQALDQRERRKYQDWMTWVDQNQNGQLESVELADRDAMTILQAGGVPIQDDTADGSKGSDLMHHKLLVIDRQTVITGSANLTWSDIHGDFSTPTSQGNANHLLKINSAAVAQQFSQEFNLMWGNGNGKTGRFGLKKPYRPPQQFNLAADSNLIVQFSPTSSKQPWSQSVNGLIGRSIQRSQDSIDFALFVFSDQQLSNLLETKAQQGVTIQGLIDPGFAYRYYSEALDLLGLRLADSRCRDEPDNRPWRQPITTVGIPQLSEGDLLHHKFAVIDDRWVITGSQNWSEAANRGNDENLLVIENVTVAAHFRREFDRLYRSAILGISAPLQAQQAAHQSRCPMPSLTRH
jgi:phosphatidylserine/phosphatidylglycerophosphate/cardiolipin synthase-like enzyme